MGDTALIARGRAQDPEIFNAQYRDLRVGHSRRSVPDGRIMRLGWPDA